MPICNKCGKMDSTAEMRRSTKAGEYLCKDKIPCKERKQRTSRTFRETTR